MWSVRARKDASGRVIQHSLLDEEGVLSCRKVVRLWQEEAGFRGFFTGLLAAAPFTAFRWETPPVTDATSDHPFEFVLVDSPELITPPDPRPFARYFLSAHHVVTFTNLGGDATLVVPCPAGPSEAYAHLAAFLRLAPELQQHALWSRVGQALQERLDTDPVWLSTAGAGVPWLHVRLDSRPKYYTYAPYRVRG